MFDALSHLDDYDANLFFCSGRCFVCHFDTHRTKDCPKCGFGMLFCKCLDDPHREWFVVIIVPSDNVVQNGTIVVQSWRRQ
jgi:hypothetical protein